MPSKYKDLSKTSKPRFRELTGQRLVQQRNQLDRARASLDRIVKHIEKKLTPDGIEAVLSVMQTLAKNPARPGAWRDRTGNLRDSIQVEVMQPNESKTTSYKYGATRITNDSKQVVGVLYAGMEYAKPLEVKSGYSVLGYAVESLKRRLTPMLIKKLKLS